ncbi:MAG TPA: TetR/AcrR family transcriptional regulator [Nevskiaceae bacterium]|nr:TetR/AcrR family transcriptional regulator [Nevskiaceae bacterium]
MKRRDQTAAAPPDRRAAVLSAALACFNEKGVEATNIGDICARAGASVGSVYHHFGNKEGIAVALLAGGLSDHVDHLERNLGKARTARQAVHVLVGTLVTWVAANPEWARYIYNVRHGSLGQAADEQLREVNARYGALLDRCFGPHFADGAFRKLPRETLPSLVIGPVHDYARRWLNGQVSGKLTEHVDVFAETAWNAVRR